MTNTIIISWPFETHVHGREGNMLSTVARMTAKQFWGAIFEPNLDPPITTGAHAREYGERIREVTASVNEHFKPHVLLYQTDTLDPDEVHRALTSGDAFGTKFYPRGATTNSHNGIEDVRKLWTPGTRPFEVLRAVGAARKVRQLHCELNFDLDGKELDPYDKEAYFFAEIMPRLLDAHPDGQWSCEHLTTAEGAAFMRKHGGPNLGCSITPHHLLFDRRDMFRGGLRPHFFCLPVIKRSTHLEALIDLIRQNLPFVYAGSDSAPHDRRKKECDCCSGGVFSAHAAVELYAMAFERAGLLDGGQFGNFMSIHGPKFYGLPFSDRTMILQKESWTVDEILPYSSDPEDTVWPLGYETDPKKRMKIEWKMAA